MKWFCSVVILLSLILCSAVHAGSQSLAGDWRFALDPDDRGIHAEWFKKHDFTETIKLPGTTDQAGKGPLTEGSEPGSLTRVHRYYGPAWYQSDITIPTETWLLNTTHTFTIPTPTPATSVTLDPDHTLPDLNRTNNTLTLN